MPSRKKKYNARFPAGRIKKIMQSDEEIGKVAQAVPVIISRTLELFVESLLKKSLVVTNTRNAKTISLSHMKYTIMQENRFDFLRELVKNIPDMGISDDGCNDDSSESPEEQSATNTKPNICYYSPQEQPINLSCNRSASTSSGNNLNGSSTAATTSRNTSYLHSTPSTSVQPQYSTTTFNNNSMKTPTTSSRNSGRNIQNQSSSSTSVAAAADNNENQALRLHLKRQWENVSRMRTQINDNDSMKLLRANSTPATPTDSSSINRSSTTPNQRSRGRTRGGGGGGLVHQPKSVPTTPLSPIVKIEFTNEPIIKIDFTNTNLQDNSQISSSSTLTATGSRTGDQGVGGGSFSTAGADLGPVVNIDLSNICTASLTTPTVATVTSPAVTIVPTASSKLELDEDYDNI